MTWTRDYIRLGFAYGGRERPAVDCWGLYRLIVGENSGVWLGEFSGVEKFSSIARTLRRQSGLPDWLPVAAGDEKAFDLVLMKGIVGKGREAIAAPLHVGCVIEPGRMIDIEETTGVMVRPFRTTSRFKVLPTLANRVLGLYRPAVLA